MHNSLAKLFKDINFNVAPSEADAFVIGIEIKVNNGCAVIDEAARVARLAVAVNAASVAGDDVKL